MLWTVDESKLKRIGTKNMPLNLEFQGINLNSAWRPRPT